MIELAFDGWVQVRLATNPDPTDEPRGVSGYTFALPGEPDLDRILRTSNPVAPRSHGPAIGVFVRGGLPALVGARLDLLGSPKFESVNEVVMEQGEEPLEPFDVELALGDFRFQRRAYLDPSRPDATVYTVQRPLLPRAEVSFSTDVLERALGTRDAVAFRIARRTLLEADLKTATDPATIAGLQRRISELRNVDPDDHRTASMSFVEARTYQLNGPTTLVDPGKLLAGLDTRVTFTVKITMGAWDADALSAYVFGTLALPVA